MKKMIFAGMAAAIGLCFVPNAQAQDDIYYSPKNSKKAVYAETASDNWSTSANDDWDVDTYNRRGPSANDTYPTSSGSTELTIPASALDATPSAINQTEVQYVHDTLYIVDAYSFSSRIRRFHNPRFAFYAYSPWYDVAYYDPFYWDYCYWDPWWYMTPSFGFHFGSWWGGWDYGYYSGWYGGWYAPYFRPHHHYHSNVWAYHSPYRHHHEHHYGHSHHGVRNNFGGNFSNRRAAERRNGTMSANRNRSYHPSGAGATRNVTNRGTSASTRSAVHSGMTGTTRNASGAATRNRSNNLTTRNSNLGTRSSATTGVFSVRSAIGPCLSSAAWYPSAWRYAISFTLSAPSSAVG